MTNPTIRRDLHIQIIRFEVEPGKSDELIAAVSEQIEGWVAAVDGFVSANFHKSADGRFVINYAQWRDKAAFQGFLDHPKQSELAAAINAVGPKSAQADSFTLEKSFSA